MLFCVDDKDKKLEVTTNGFGESSLYTFCGSTSVDEETMFRHFKHHMFKSASLNRINRLDDNDNTFPPFSGYYLIPKLFGYFPFLDCDTPDVYADAIVHLKLDDIPFKAYRSNRMRESYWIFCDRQGTFNDTLDFIEGYPGDHRYSWIARHKQEMCVRAVPKYGAIPSFDDDHMVNTYTDDFKYWVSRFDKYWKHGIIPTYLDTIGTLDSL